MTRQREEAANRNRDEALAAAVVLRAVQDISAKNAAIAADARSWLVTPYAKWLAESAGIEAGRYDATVAALLAGQMAPARKARAPHS